MTLRVPVRVLRTGQVLAVKESFSGEPLDVVVDQGVEHSRSLPLGVHELREAQLREVLRDRSRVGTHVLGQVVHCMTAV